MSEATRLSSANRSSLVLLAFILGAGLLLLVLNTLTSERIRISRDALIQKQLIEVLSDDQKSGSPSITVIDTSEFDADSQHHFPLYHVTKDGESVGFILTVVAPNGYSGKIDMLVGIDPKGAVTGVRVTNHRETPGLGDDIDIARSDWIQSFDAKSLDQIPTAAWSVKQEQSRFDAFTGATITPRAVVQAVYRALVWFSDNQATILKS